MAERSEAADELLRLHAQRTGLDGWAALAEIDRAAGPRRVYPPRPHVPDGEPELDLPDRVVYAVEALAVIEQLWPVLVDALQPGEAGPSYTRIGDNRLPIDMTCPGCGQERVWREPTSWEAVAAGREQLRPYCPETECQVTPLAPSPAPVDLGPLDAIIEVELSLMHADRVLRRALEMDVPPAGHPIGRIGEIAAMLTPAARRRPGLFERVEKRLVSCARQVSLSLRNVEQVVKIPAPCPHCSTRSLVMYPERGLQRQRGEAGLIQCTFPECVCLDTACRCNHRGWVDDGGRRPFASFRHQWTNDEWDRLSVLIEVNLRDLARSA